MESSLVTIHATVLVQGALLQAMAWSKSKNTEITYEFSQQCNGLIKELNSNENPNKELIEAVIKVRESITKQLPKR